MLFKEHGWKLAREFTGWFDLVHIESVVQAAALRNADDLSIIKTPTPTNYIAPLPVFDLELNPNLIQNPEGNISKR